MQAADETLRTILFPGRLRRRRHRHDRRDLHRTGIVIIMIITNQRVSTDFEVFIIHSFRTISFSECNGETAVVIVPSVAGCDSIGKCVCVFLYTFAHLPSLFLFLFVRAWLPYDAPVEAKLLGNTREENVVRVMLQQRLLTIHWTAERNIIQSIYRPVADIDIFEISTTENSNPAY
jgi:hypothetical protein